MRRRLVAIAALAGAATIALTGCTSSLPNISGADGDSPQTASASPTTDADPTCDNIIADTLVQEFAKLGWTSNQEEFMVGSTTVPGGLQCKWGDFSGDASELVQMYGWAPVDDDQTAELEQYLLDSGWKKEEDDSLVYLTEPDPQPSWSDDDGYGMTYAFGDGWVLLSDTKQGLGVITWRK
ncbi:MAG: hypothetical protein QM607_02005 [Microbacterium sp.]